LANGFFLVSTGFSFFLWKMEQKLALFRESVLPVLEVVYVSSWSQYKIQKKGLIAMNEALKEAETKVTQELV
jgi:hypothetical protein